MPPRVPRGAGEGALRGRFEPIRVGRWARGAAGRAGQIVVRDALGSAALDLEPRRFGPVRNQGARALPGDTWHDQM